VNKGYFSSNRDKSVDIFSFTTKAPQIFYDKIQKENQLCFTLEDNGAIEIDTLNLKYMWNFGDGEKAQGNKVVHCFPGPGNYTVRLDIFDIRTNRLFFTKLIYMVKLKEFKQPFINSPDTVIKGMPVNFDGLDSNIPGFQILSYSWNFRDGEKGKGDKLSHTFKKNGDFRVNMELVVKSNSTGEIHKTGTSKFVKVLNDNTERAARADKSTSSAAPDIRNYENSETRVLFSAENDFSKDEVYHVELLSSKVKIGTKNAVFKNIPGKYIITEKFDPADSSYSYIVDQQMNLMSTYPAYSELYTLGFKNVRVKTFVLTDPSEKELHNLIRINGAYADSYFDATDKLTSNAYIMLDQIVKLLNKYPAIKLEIAVHSDNTGSAPTSLALSQSRAQLLVSYMVNRGISTRRLRATGFGSTKPIASNNTDRERRLNRRIDFIIIP
jgi:outer membrane protein OmpA-like peptidoglycan-associated protein